MTTLFSPIREFFKKGDVLLLFLCLTASGYGLALIYSATRYSNSNRPVIVQSVALLLGICVYIFLSMVDIEIVMKKWKWMVGINIVLIGLLLTPLGIGGETKYFDATDGVHTAHIRRAQGPAGEIELGMINVSEIRSGDGWWFLNTGVPHYVEMVHDVDGIDVNGRGRGIRYDTGRFPQGTNVNFVEVTGNGAIRMRTYERGVEHETLACGTGATAAAIITNYALQHGTTKYRIQVPGGELIVGFTHEAGTQNYTNIRLTGPARRVFSGVFETDNF